MKKILVTTDLSEASFVAFHRAKLQADAIGKDRCEIVLVTVLEHLLAATTYVEFGLTKLEEPVIQKWSKSALDALREVSKEHFEGYYVKETVIVGSKHPAEELSDLGEKIMAEMIVLASHGRTGLGKLMLGSVTEKVVRLSSRPVLVVFSDSRARRIEATEAHNERRHVLALTDLTDESYSVFPHAAHQLTVDAEKGEQLTLLYVCEDLTRATFGLSLGEDVHDIQKEMELRAQNELDGLRDRYFPGKLVNSVVVRGSKPVYEVVSQYARTHFVDIIVATTHGHSGITRTILGGLTSRLIRTSPCPLLIVRPEKQAG